MIYHDVPSRETECYFCGETKMCHIRLADVPDGETGYVDEWAICKECEDVHEG
jgi:hypothetical protein